MEVRADESSSDSVKDATMSEKKQSDLYFTVPVTMVDLYWVRENEKLEEGEEPSQTEFDGELFFNDEVYEYVCEADGKSMTSGYVDDESGVAYCLEHVGELVCRGDSRIVKREVAS
jgi:hypothetical protein